MKQFKNYLQDKGYSPVTVKEYQRQTGLFIKWYSDKDVINCQKRDILDYLSYLKNQKQVEVISRNNALTALRHYFDCLLSDSQITTNPTALIKLRGLNRRKLPHIYTTEEMTELVDRYYFLEVKRTHEKLTAGTGGYFHKRTYFVKMRNYVMLQFFVYQGITTREILELQTDDIQLHKAGVSIPKGTQRGNARTLPLNATQIGSLMQYLNEIRPQLANPESGTLFLSIPQSNYKAVKKTEVDFRHFVKQLKRLDRNFEGFAQIRASVITGWIKNFGLRKAQYMAGHKSIVSTEEYLPNYIEDLADDMTKFNPF